MPPLIQLSKSDLHDFARVVILANTPLSLFRGMIATSGIRKLRSQEPGDLTAYYDRLTARAGRSEIVVGLAYAIICAAILQRRDGRFVSLDASRLQWGQRIWDVMSRTGTATSRIILTPEEPRRTAVPSFRSGSTGGLVLGPDGRPVR